MNIYYIGEHWVAAATEEAALEFYCREVDEEADPDDIVVKMETEPSLRVMDYYDEDSDMEVTFWDKMQADILKGYEAKMPYIFAREL